MDKTNSLRARALLTIAALAIIILMQLGVMVCFANAKEGFDIDELWTFGLANSYDEPFVSYEYGEWLNGRIFSDYLTVGNHAHEYLNVYENQGDDVHPPLYYLCIHAVCSISKVFSKWNGILVNLVCFSITQAALFALACLVLADGKRGWEMIRPEALCPVAVYGFGAGAVSAVVFIRMYAMMTMWAVLLVMVLVLLWKYGQKKALVYALKAVLILGFLTQYYFLIFASMFCAVYFFACLGFCKKKEAGEFVGACMKALLLSVAFFPWCLEHIFGGYRGQEAMENAAAFNITDLAGWIGEMLQVLNQEQFAGMLPLLLGVALTLFAAGVVCHGKYDCVAIGFSVCTLFAAAAYLSMIALIAPYKVDRYIFCIFPLVSAAVWMLLAHGFQRVGMRMKMATAIATVALLCADTGTLVGGRVNYLFEGHDEYVRLSKEHGDLPCIVRGDYYLTKNLLELGSYDSVYILRSKAESEILSALEAHDTYDPQRGFVLYELFGEPDAVERIVDATDANESQLLYNNRYNVYLIR